MFNLLDLVLSVVLSVVLSLIIGLVLSVLSLIQYAKLSKNPIIKNNTQHLV